MGVTRVVGVVWGGGTNSVVQVDFARSLSVSCKYCLLRVVVVVSSPDRAESTDRLPHPRAQFLKTEESAEIILSWQPYHRGPPMMTRLGVYKYADGQKRLTLFWRTNI